MAAKIITISNQKGGIGKTTVAFNTASALVEKGYKVLCIDNDPQGDFSTVAADGVVFITNNSPEPSHTLAMYSLDPETVIKPAKLSDSMYFCGASKILVEVESKGPETWFMLADNGRKVAEELGVDFVVIDSLPGFGTLQTAALIAADYVVIPTPLDSLPYKAVSEQLNSIELTQKRMNPNLQVAGILLNNINVKQMTNIEQHFLDEFKEESQTAAYVMDTMIRSKTEMKEATALNKSIFEYKPKSLVAEDYRSYVDELLQRMEIKA